MMNNLHLTAEPDNRATRSGMDRGVLVVAEGRGRLSGRGSRLSRILTWSFIGMAACMALTDLFRLMAAN